MPNVVRLPAKKKVGKRSGKPLKESKDYAYNNRVTVRFTKRHLPILRAIEKYCNKASSNTSISDFFRDAAIEKWNRIKKKNNHHD